MRPDPILDPSTIDFSQCVADLAAIQAINPHRFEFQQLDAVVYLDKTTHILIGYKDLTPTEFWVRGHMPGYPVMPGVLMCEAAAQLCSFYTTYARVIDNKILGLGGFDNFAFRAQVKPGDRLTLMAKGLKISRRQCLYHVQGFVGSTMVFHGEINGMPIASREVTES